MTGKRNGPPSYVAWCPDHEKYLWISKKEAKLAARLHHPRERLTPYRCETRDGLWHYGHLNPLVITRGIEQGRDGRH